jgi:arylsulfatase A-like enzyme
MMMTSVHTRRDFLKASGFATVGILSGACCLAQPTLTLTSKSISKSKRPNIIYIFTDQQSATMMSCAGNKWLKTPAMDYIAENGIRFTRAYTTNPVCSPARVSIMTGRFPGYFNDNKGKPARENSGSMAIANISDEVKNTTIAAYLKKAGYDLVYGGKEHLPKELTPKALGFNDICNDQRQKLAEETGKYIKAEHDKPYFMIVSLINPHDICYMVIREYASPKRLKQTMKAKKELAALDKALELPEGISEEEFFAKYCPPIPDNYAPQKDEPLGVQAMLDSRLFRRVSREKYGEKKWRLHRWAYCRLTEMVDKKVQIILNAIKESGQEENTLVIFSSDHGDMDAAHRMEGKSALYEESVNIPFMAMWKGHIKPGQVNDTDLISNGLDFLPTVCDYAGINGKADPRGKSLRLLFEGKKTKCRKTLGIEAEFGRMVVSDEKLKYLRYDAKGIEEHLIDLNADPYEKTHVTDDPKYASRLTELRKSFDTKWFPGVKG